MVLPQIKIVLFKTSGHSLPILVIFDKMHSGYRTKAILFVSINISRLRIGGMSVNINKDLIGSLKYRLCMICILCKHQPTPRTIEISESDFDKIEIGYLNKT